MERIWGENEKMEGENGEMERGGKNGERGKNGEGKTFTPSLCLLVFAFASLFPHFSLSIFSKCLNAIFLVQTQERPLFLRDYFGTPLIWNKNFSNLKVSFLAILG